LDIKASRNSGFVHYRGGIYCCLRCIQGGSLVKGSFGCVSKVQYHVYILYDTQSAIHLATNTAYHRKTKHIDVKYHLVRQVVDEGGVALKKVHTQENYVKMFIKPILLEKLLWILASLGLQKR